MAALIPSLPELVHTAPGNQPDAVNLVDLLDQLKQDIYTFQVNNWWCKKNPNRQWWDKTRSLTNNPSDLVEISIDHIKVVLTVKTDITNSGDVGLKVPIGEVTIGPDLKLDRKTENTHTLTFAVTPVDIETPGHEPNQQWQDWATDPNNLKARPIPNGLIRFRDSVNAVAAQGILPWFNFDTSKPTSGANAAAGKPDSSDSSGDSIEVGFQVVNEFAGTFGINFLVFSLSAAHASSHTATNTLTVGFKTKGIAIV
jgi:hypothetical protein